MEAERPRLAFLLLAPLVPQDVGPLLAKWSADAPLCTEPLDQARRASPGRRRRGSARASSSGGDRGRRSAAWPGARNPASSTSGDGRTFNWRSFAMHVLVDEVGLGKSQPIVAVRIRAIERHHDPRDRRPAPGRGRRPPSRRCVRRRSPARARRRSPPRGRCSELGRPGHVAARAVAVDGRHRDLLLALSARSPGIRASPRSRPARVRRRPAPPRASPSAIQRRSRSYSGSSAPALAADMRNGGRPA